MNKFIGSFLKLLSVSLLIYFLVGISLGIYNNKKDIKVIKEKIAEEEKISIELNKKEKEIELRIVNIRNPKEVEKMAREVLNMKKPDESIYRVINNK